MIPRRAASGWRLRLAALLVLAAPAALANGPALAPSIGTARMLPDRTVEMALTARDHGMIGHGRLTYRPGDPHYDEVLRHLGGLRPGEVKPVPPWPDAAD